MVNRGDRVPRLNALAFQLGAVPRGPHRGLLGGSPEFPDAHLKLATVREDGEPTRRRECEFFPGYVLAKVELTDEHPF